MHHVMITSHNRSRDMSHDCHMFISDDDDDEAVSSERWAGAESKEEALEARLSVARSIHG